LLTRSNILAKTVLIFRSVKHLNKNDVIRLIESGDPITPELLC
jgi:hypothetical protein